MFRMTSDVTYNRTRLALCKPPLFPGAPSNYRYQPEKCVLISRNKKAGTAKNNTQTTQKAVQRAIDRAELSALGDVTGAWVQLPMKLPIDPSLVDIVVTQLEAKDASIIQVFRKMISHGLRSKFPDPVKRIAHLQRTDKLLSPGMKLIVRYRVFRLMEAHLVEVMASTLAQK